MRTLLLDNHDSFTWNLFGLLAQVNGEDPVVVRNDEASAAELARLGFDNLVVSPGPGRPDRAADFGVCAAAIAAAEVPVLGICLGHQGLGWLAGAPVVPAPLPVHGRASTVRHAGNPLFAGIPDEFEAIRYHSLCLRLPLPAELEPIAWAEEDDVLMALAHRTLPRWGVQFHPESIGTEHGRRLLANFRDLTAAASPTSVEPRKRDRGRPRHGKTTAFASPQGPAPTLRTRCLVGDRDAEQAFEALWGEREEAFWLDSAAGPGEGARFSFLGAPGPIGSRVTYDLAAGEVTVRRQGGVEVHAESIFDYLDRELKRLRPAPHELPFDFDCGFVGYFGYELKAECGGERRHRAATPDAGFIFADRLVALDHGDGRTYVLCLAEPGGEEEAERWLDAAVARLEPLPAGHGAAARRFPEARADGAGEPAVEFSLARSERRYLEDIAACRRALLEGESYELCLTNRVRSSGAPAPLPLYRALRRANPAPFGALLRLGPELAVLSSSPERFLRIDPDGAVEARPIKGTAARSEDPAEDARAAAALAADAKNRAENLMIVDLLRNDLGRVCEPGTVAVPALMEVESFATVHQLVSTVRGRLRAGAGALDCVRAAFPPGSMTGAPKERTMAILDRLEGEARGVFSGAIGYLGLGGGADLSVAIRTIVRAGDGRAEIGAGGAIVIGSEAEAELGEMLLKAWAPMRALDPALPADYSRSRFGAETSRVTPRKSITSSEAETSAA